MPMTDLYATVRAEVESIQSLVVTQKAQVPTIDFDKQFQAVKRRLQQLHDLSSSQATELSGLVLRGVRGLHCKKAISWTRSMVDW